MLFLILRIGVVLCLFNILFIKIIKTMSSDINMFVDFTLFNCYSKYVCTICTQYEINL